MHHDSIRLSSFFQTESVSRGTASAGADGGVPVYKVAIFAALLLLGACSENKSASNASPIPTSSAVLTAAVAAQPTALEAQLKQEKTLLLAEVESLKKKIEDLAQTPQVLLESVQAALIDEKLSDAQALAEKLEQRYGASAQSKAARTGIAQLQAKLKAKEELAQKMEAMGFYALKPTSAAKANDFIVKVESLTVGTRWTFDSHDTSYMYRDARRGKKFVLLKTTLVSTDKSSDPYLPDIAVYRIEGKSMTRMEPMNFEFRQWQGHGTYIGLYHDFKNDFAHSASVAFNAGASIDEDVAKTPFAVVLTDVLCHERKTKIGQPEIEYRYRQECAAKSNLTAEDFKSGDYQILSFFNKPKGL